MNSNITHFDCNNCKNSSFEESSENSFITIPCKDVNEFVEKFIEFGEELTRLQNDLFAHQTKVRRILLDSGDDDS